VKTTNALIKLLTTKDAEKLSEGIKNVILEVIQDDLKNNLDDYILDPDDIITLVKEIYNEFLIEIKQEIKEEFILKHKDKLKKMLIENITINL